MGFKAGTYAKLWHVVNKNGFVFGNVTVSRKDDSAQNGYRNTFSSSSVGFKFDADKKIKEIMKGWVSKKHYSPIGKESDSNGKYDMVIAPPDGKPFSIRIEECDVENMYNSAKKTTYTNFYIYNFETSDHAGNSGKRSASAKEQQPASGGFTEVDDDELPF